MAFLATDDPGPLSAHYGVPYNHRWKELQDYSQMIYDRYQIEKVFIKLALQDIFLLEAHRLQRATTSHDKRSRKLDVSS